MNQFKNYFEVFLVNLIAKKYWFAIWPFLRSRVARRCQKCILSEKYTPLNKDGLCKICSSEKTENNEDTISDKNNIKKILDEYSGKGKDYDAVLLFSGGKDSSYLLWRLKKDYPNLRVKGILVDTGFMSPVALQNANKVINNFGIEFNIIRPEFSFVKEVFRYGLKNVKNQKNYSIVDLLDGQIIFDTARKYAAQFQIPLVICGLSKNQVKNVYGEGDSEFLEKHEINPVVSQLGVSLEEAFSESANKFWYKRTDYNPGSIPRFILPMVEWDPSEEEIVEALEKENILEEKNTGPLLTNNSLIPLISVVEINQFGYTSFEIEFAKTIREGKAPRAYWIRIFQLIEYSGLTGNLLGKAIDETLKRLDLTKKDIGIRF